MIRYLSSVRKPKKRIGESYNGQYHGLQNRSCGFESCFPCYNENLAYSFIREVFYSERPVIIFDVSHILQKRCRRGAHAFLSCQFHPKQFPIFLQPYMNCLFLTGDRFSTLIIVCEFLLFTRSFRGFLPTGDALQLQKCRLEFGNVYKNGLPFSKQSITKLIFIKYLFFKIISICFFLFYKAITIGIQSNTAISMTQYFLQGLNINPICNCD